MRRVLSLPVFTVLSAVLLAGSVALTPTMASGVEDPPQPISQNPTNPLAGGPWGVFSGSDFSKLYPAYAHAVKNKQHARAKLLAKEALQPTAVWFSYGSSNTRIVKNLTEYIANEQHGNPNTLVQMSIFREFPEGEGNRTKPLTSAEVRDYKVWVKAAAKAIGNARVAMVLEPDNAEVAPQPNPSAPNTGGRETREKLVSFAAKTFSALPRTSVYIDCGDADWLPVATATTLLEKSGIKYARGFALGATHYSSVAGNVTYATAIIKRLKSAGYRTKHAVIDTADNGHAFTWTQYNQKHGQATFDNAKICSSKSETVCNALGIAPTWRVKGTSQTKLLHFSSAQTREAATLIDGYLWFGRPWQYNQATQFVLSRALGAAKYTRFAEANTTGGTPKNKP